MHTQTNSLTLTKGNARSKRRRRRRWWVGGMSQQRADAGIRGAERRTGEGRRRNARRLEVLDPEAEPRPELGFS